MAGPRLVLCVRGQVGEHHLHSLELLVLGWNGANFVCHLVSFHWDVLPLDVRHVYKYVLCAVLWSDEAVALGAGELLTNALEDRASRGTSRRRVCSGSLGGEGAGQVPEEKIAPLPDPTSLPVKGEGGPDGRLRGMERWDCRRGGRV